MKRISTVILTSDYRAFGMTETYNGEVWLSIADCRDAVNHYKLLYRCEGLKKYEARRGMFRFLRMHIMRTGVKVVRVDKGRK